MATGAKGTSGDYRKYVGLGLQLPAAVLLGCLAGWWADGRLGTEPWLLIAGAAVGLAAGFASFLATVLRLERDETDRRRKDGQG